VELGKGFVILMGILEQIYAMILVLVNAAMA
jgi:hypothetical protein